MATYYVRSTDGSNSDNGSTWALAKATLAGALAVASAGDTIYVSQAHAETQATSMTLTSAGTATNPVRIICVNDGAEPPTTLATTGTVSTTGATSITMTGCAYVYGLTFTAGSGASSGGMYLFGSSGNTGLMEACSLVLGTSSSGYQINLGSASSAVELQNTTVKFGGSGQSIACSSVVRITGGGIASGGTSPTTLFYGSTYLASVLVEDFDMSNGSSSMNLSSTASSYALFTFRNCKLPASWTGAVSNGYSGYPDFWSRMHNCDNAGTNYRLWERKRHGDIKHNTAVYKNDGASNGTTPSSISLATQSSAKYPMLVLRHTFDLAAWNATTGSSVTATVELLHDGASAFTDQDVWMELHYMGASGSPLGTLVSSRASLVATAQALTTSSATWTGASGTGPNGSSTWNALKLTASFTPQLAGPILATVCMAIPSKTIYVDPKLTLT